MGDSPGKLAVKKLDLCGFQNKNLVGCCFGDLCGPFVRFDFVLPALTIPRCSDVPNSVDFGDPLLGSEPCGFGSLSGDVPLDVACGVSGFTDASAC